MNKVNFFKPSWVICQEAAFLNFMVMHVRKSENDGAFFREWLKEKFRKKFEQN